MQHKGREKKHASDQDVTASGGKPVQQEPTSQWQASTNGCVWATCGGRRPRESSPLCPNHKSAKQPPPPPTSPPLHNPPPQLQPQKKLGRARQTKRTRSELPAKTDLSEPQVRGEGHSAALSDVHSGQARCPFHFWDMVPLKPCWLPGFETLCWVPCSCKCSLGCGENLSKTKVLSKRKPLLWRSELVVHNAQLGQPNFKVLQHFKGVQHPLQPRIKD